MNHIADPQLNEYLDQTLEEDIQRQYELHISSCPDCRARLEELKRLYSDLASLNEIQIPRDLTSAIKESLPLVSTDLWTRTFAVQLGMASGMVLFILIEISKFIHAPDLSSLQMPSLEFPSLIAIIPSPGIAQPAFMLPHLSTFQVPLTSLQVFVIVTSALLLGLIGNGILLCERDGSRK